MEQDLVFKALADPTRRKLLDLLLIEDGRSLSELEAQMPMTRFGVMKHLGVLKEAGLVTTQKSGRETLHYLNAAPIRMAYNKWAGKYAADHAAPQTDLNADTPKRKWQRQKLRKRPGKFFRSATQR